MEILFSCVADEKYNLSDLCIDITENLAGKFQRKNYGLKIKKLFIYFICTDFEVFSKFKSKYDKKENYIILFTKTDKIVVSTYKNLDLKLALGKYAIDKIQQFITDKRFPGFRLDLLVKDFVNIYSKEILLDEYFLLP